MKYPIPFKKEKKKKNHPPQSLIPKIKIRFLTTLSNLIPPPPPVSEIEMGR